MSPKEDPSPTAVLPLQDWLKLLAGRGVNMRVGMGLAAKIYNTHNTREKLSKLDAKKLTPLIPDKEARKTVINAVKGIDSGETFVKKRTKDSDLLEPLRAEKEALPASLDFKDITDQEVLIPVSVTVNRAPVKTAWAYTVALRMGFDVQEALSIAHVYVHLSSMKHALMLGNILNKEETKAAEEELRELPGDEPWFLKKKAEKEAQSKYGWNRKGKQKEVANPIGSSQPWVGILKAKIPVIERPDGTWRAIEKGIPVTPSPAYFYITKAFKDYTPHVMGSLKLLAASYEVEELNRIGMHMYNSFKPDVEEWGQRGILHCSKILDELKGPVDVEDVPPEVETAGLDQTASISLKRDIDALSDGVSDLSEPPPMDDEDIYEPVTKRSKMSLEEYEAMLDAEAEGGFLEGADIAPESKAR